MTKPTGYLVIECCEDWEQALRLRYGPTIPAQGILDWERSRKDARAMFASRAEAQAAINRTEHYRLLWGSIFVPEKANCRIVPVIAVGQP